jgi:hypothetical protein
MKRKTLCIATRNTHKAHELATVLAPLWEVKCSADYPEISEDIEETGDTFLANATLKAVATSRRFPIMRWRTIRGWRSMRSTARRAFSRLATAAFPPRRKRTTPSCSKSWPRPAP